MTAVAVPSRPEPPAPAARVGGLLTAVVFGTLVVQLDGTMLGVALNAIRERFDIDLATLQWVTTGYLVSMTLVIPVAGWAMTRLGARRLWLLCLLVFAATALVSATAPSAAILIWARVLQGAAGGMLIPVGQALLAQAAGPGQLGRLMGAIGLPSMMGVVLGPPLGGAIVTHLGWQWIFWLNLPVILIAFATAALLIPRGSSSASVPLDRLGVVLLPTGLAMVVFGATHGTSLNDPTAPSALLPAAAGAVLTAVFVWHSARTRHPLIDVRLLLRRSFAASAAVMTLTGFTMFGLLLLVPLYLQQARGFTALHAGALALPQGVGMAVSLIAAGRLIGKVSPRLLALAGIAVTAAGLILLAQVGTDTTDMLVAVAGLLAGLGLGATTVTVTTAAYHGLDNEHIPQATSAIRVFQQLGGVLGSAVLAIILQAFLRTHAATPTGAFGSTFLWACILTLAALPPALLLPKNLANPPTSDLVGAR